MRSETLGSRILSKRQVLADFQRIESQKHREATPPRTPTLALRLATSFLGGRPFECSIPARVLREGEVQVFCGFPTNNAFLLFKKTGETTAQKISGALFPRHMNRQLPPEERFKVKGDLPPVLKSWLDPIPDMIKEIQGGNLKVPPPILLNFPMRTSRFWISRAETLCGQVVDGSHRVLAYTLLALDLPEFSVAIRIVSIPPLALTLLNCLTLTISFFLNPLWCLRFVKKRFVGSAFFQPERIS